MFCFTRTVLITPLAFTVRSVWTVSMVMPLMELLVTAKNAHVRVHAQPRECAPIELIGMTKGV